MYSLQQNVHNDAISTVMGKIRRTMAIFCTHISNCITTIITAHERWNVDCRRIYRQRPVHEAIIRPLRRSRTWCMVLSNMMDFVDVLFFGDLRPDDEARQFFRPFWPDAELDHSSPLRVVPWPMKTNPAIGMARHRPNRPMLARLGGDSTIRSLQVPF